MNSYRCPRCGQIIPSWQPIHLSCLIFRLRYPIGILFTFILLFTLPPIYQNVSNLLASVHESKDYVINNDSTVSPVAIPSTTSEVNALDLPLEITVTIESVAPTKTPRGRATQTQQTHGRAEISCENNIYFVRLRRNPGLSDATDKIYEIPCGEVVELLGPSRKVDGLTWWQVSWNRYSGWIADHTQSGKKILIFMATPTPTAYPTETAMSSPVSDLTPTTFIKNYFDTVNNNDYETSYSMLSDAYQANQSYNDYVSFWETVDKVEILSIAIRSQNASQAMIYVEAHYYYEQGYVTTGHTTYKLIKSGNSWLIDPN